MVNVNHLIDSNVLIYAYDRSDNVKHKKAVELLSKCWEGKIMLAISAQNLAEFFVVVTTKLKPALSIREAEQIVQDIVDFSHWKVLSYNEHVLLKAIKMHKTHFWDALIAATMLEHGIFTIYTENTADFSQFANIKAINPFR